MSSIDDIKSLPDISFIDDLTLEDVRLQMINDYQDKYYELTGEKKTLGQADPDRLKLYACTMQIYQALRYIDNAGKMNLLKYSYGDYKKNLGGLKGVTKSMGSASKTTIRFKLSTVKTSAVTIPSGTRVTAGDNVYFYLPETAEIAIGNNYIDASVTCTEPGAFANGYEIGTINILVDPVPYINSVENIKTSAGGADEDTEDEFAERIYLAPSGYSVAGPEDAYIYWTKAYNSNISDVAIDSPSTCAVNIYFILSDGKLPGETLVGDLQRFWDDFKKKPQTDLVTVAAPSAVNYSIKLTYWIDKSNSSNAVAIQTKVNNAIGDYTKWQSGKIGCDINPSELSKKIMVAGAKRVDIVSPVYTVVADKKAVACLSSQTVTYGGLE